MPALPPHAQVNALSPAEAAPLLADRVLLVEDQEEDIELFRRALAKSGVSCGLDIVMDGETAICWLTEKLAEIGCGRAVLPRAIFLDLRLPGIDGSEVLRWIRAQPALTATTVVVCSVAVTERRDLTATQCLGADAFLAKSPRPETVAAVLATRMQNAPLRNACGESSLA
jgi:CheY-like chemotaxis protein